MGGLGFGSGYGNNRDLRGATRQGPEAGENYAVSGECKSFPERYLELSLGDKGGHPGPVQW